MSNLKKELESAIQRKFNFDLNKEQQKRFDFEIGFIALESIIDKVKSFDSKVECMAYLESLFLETEK